MFKQFQAIFLASLLGLAGGQALAQAKKEIKPAESAKEVFNVVADKSKLTWTGKKVTGEHYGTVAVKSGHLTFQGTELVGGEFVVDMNTLVVQDITDKEMNGKLKTHLESEDFFSVKTYPEAKFVIKNAQLGKGGVYNITGDLTVKGQTKPVLFDANLDRKPKQVTADASMVFNRMDYGIKYNSGSAFDPKKLGDKLIYDDVKLQIHLETQKK